MRSRTTDSRGVEHLRATVSRNGAVFIGLESPVEDLGLSVRTRNALRGIGCDTVEDALRLDLSAPVRGLGRKCRGELLAKLGRAGFHHPGENEQPVSELRSLVRSLERIEGRMNAALAAVAKEIGAVKQRLRKKLRGRPGETGAE